ncbi:unnamed protein product [Effrenium voratum]|nr:unnamed protein product [Effrenium voratum]
MAFVAGMICFSCQPTWSAYVWRNGVGEVVGVNIKPESCIYVDRGCGPFGRAVRKAYLHIMESKLAKRSHKPLPDFSMYFSRVEMCQWLRNFLAMQPIVFEARSVQRRLAQNSTTSSPFRTAALPRAIARATALPTAAPRTQAPLEATKAALALDPAEDGLHTDFEVQFPPP